MGRIKGTLVKRTTKELVTNYKTKFSGDFEANKKAVFAILPTASKKVRNSVSGYISRIMKRAEKK